MRRVEKEKVEEAGADGWSEGRVTLGPRPRPLKRAAGSGGGKQRSGSHTLTRIVNFVSKFEVAFDKQR